MPEQNSNALDEILVEVYRAIFSALESRLHLIGSVIDAESRKEILAQQIYDKATSMAIQVICCRQLILP